MKIIADLHIHSKYSRATSRNMNIFSIANFANVKGLNIIGTGDFSQPMWIKELKNNLVEVNDTNLFLLKNKTNNPIRFMITNEVCTTFKYDKKVKRIHHIILAPNFEIVDQINDRLSVYGNLSNDGRPNLNMSAPELVEEMTEISDKIVVIPAHIWTPWFSLFGSFSGFDSVEDCYKDMTKHIFALETGLSSDPPMNRRISSLDKYTLISNSDSHSPYPYRIGREATCFELEETTYHEVINTIREKNRKHLKFTIETYPDYGKYHWTGHRKCNISLPASEAKGLNDVCPVCHRKLTIGVEERVEELSDRPTRCSSRESTDYMHLLPLHVIISNVLGSNNLSNSKVWNLYNSLISRFHNEYNILLDVPRHKLVKATDPRVAEAIVKVRRGEVKITPGYDGVYGNIEILGKKEIKNQDEISENSNGQLSLDKFM